MYDHDEMSLFSIVLGSVVKNVYLDRLIGRLVVSGNQTITDFFDYFQLFLINHLAVPCSSDNRICEQ